MGRPGCTTTTTRLARRCTHSADRLSLTRRGPSTTGIRNCDALEGPSEADVSWVNTTRVHGERPDWRRRSRCSVRLLQVVGAGDAPRTVTRIRSSGCGTIPAHPLSRGRVGGLHTSANALKRPGSVFVVANWRLPVAWVLPVECTLLEEDLKPRVVEPRRREAVSNSTPTHDPDVFFGYRLGEKRWSPWMRAGDTSLPARVRFGDRGSRKRVPASRTYATAEWRTCSMTNRCGRNHPLVERVSD